MAWYWWVLIGIGVVGIGALKLTFFKAWMEKRKEQNQPIEDE